MEIQAAVALDILFREMRFVRRKKKTGASTVLFLKFKKTYFLHRLQSPAAEGGGALRAHHPPAFRAHGLPRRGLLGEQAHVRPPRSPQPSRVAGLFSQIFTNFDLRFTTSSS